MLPEPEPWPTPGRVLLVEDDVLLRFLLAEKLRDAGLGVIEAANADEAFSYIQTAAQIDLLFTDVQMPGSMDGVGLARRIGTGYPSIRIILTSGNTVLPADNAGLFLPKPYDVDHAVSVVFETLGLKRPSSP
jgi:two-component system, response regulator PdtaR